MDDVVSINKISDAGVVSLMDAIAWGALVTLRKLSLAHNEIGDEGARALTSAICNGALRHPFVLDVSNNNVGEAARKALISACEVHGIGVEV